jgi:beta-lactamase class A
MRKIRDCLRQSAVRQIGLSATSKTAFTILTASGNGTVLGASHRGAVAIYPASVVKLFFLVALQAWLSAGLLSRTREQRRASAAMIRRSSNDATAYIVDLLTGTTGGPELPPAALRRWLHRRGAVQRYFERWGWPEFASIRITQKTWEESPYGREQQSRTQVRNNRNRLTTEAVARLLWSIDRGEAVSKPACREIRRLLHRPIDASSCRRHADNQIDGFLGEGLPGNARIWSKAGWTSKTRHDAAIIELTGGRRFVLVVFSEGRKLAENSGLLPAMAREAARLMASLENGPEGRRH